MVTEPPPHSPSSWNGNLLHDTAPHRVLDEGMAGKPRFDSGPKPIQKANIHIHISS